MEQVDIVDLKEHGFIKVFKVIKTEDDIEYWAINDLTMTDLLGLKYAEISWMIRNVSSWN